MEPAKTNEHYFVEKSLRHGSSFLIEILFMAIYVYKRRLIGILSGSILKCASSLFITICPPPKCLPGLLFPTPIALQLCCATALFSDIEKEGPKWL